MTLTVSASGKSVTASFPGVREGSKPRRALFYCNVGVAMKSQVTKPAKISKTGSFTATIRDKLAEEPGVPLKQVMSGTFKTSQRHRSHRRERRLFRVDDLHREGGMRLSPASSV